MSGQRATPRHRVAGMTLMEVLMVAALLGVLLVLATPGYRGYVLRVHRAEATTALLALAAAQEIFYLRHQAYAAQLTAAPPDGLGLPPASPGGYYTLAVTRADADEFAATATATGAQADDTRCRVFTIDHVGTKSATNAECWSR